MAILNKSRTLGSSNRGITGEVRGGARPQCYSVHGQLGYHFPAAVPRGEPRDASSGAPSNQVDALALVSSSPVLLWRRIERGRAHAAAAEIYRNPPSFRSRFRS